MRLHPKGDDGDGAMWMRLKRTWGLAVVLGAAIISPCLSLAAGEGDLEACRNVGQLARKARTAQSYLDAISCYAGALETRRSVSQPSASADSEAAISYAQLTVFLRYHHDEVEQWYYAQQFLRYTETHGTSVQEREAALKRAIADEMGALTNALKGMGYVRVLIRAPEGSLVVVPVRGRLPAALFSLPAPAEWWFQRGQPMNVIVRLGKGYEDYVSTAVPEDLPASNDGQQQILNPAPRLAEGVVRAEQARLRADDHRLTGGPGLPCHGAYQDSPRGRSGAWETFHRIRALGWKDAQGEATERVTWWRAVETCCTEARAAATNCEDGERSSSPVAKLGSTCGAVYPAFAKEAERLESRWRSARCRILRGSWEQVMDEADCESSKPGAAGGLERVARESCQVECSWCEESLAQARDCRALPERRFVPHVSLGWGRLPDLKWSTDPFAHETLRLLRDERPDFHAGTLVRVLGTGSIAKDAVRAHGAGVESPRDVEAPLPMSPRFDLASAGDNAIGALRLGFVHPYPLSGSRLQDAGFPASRFAALVDGGFDLLAGTSPSQEGVGGIAVALGANAAPIDWINATFPYPANVIRTHATVMAQVGDRNGVFELRLGGGGYFRATPFGSLPQALFNADGAFSDIAAPEPPPDPFESNSGDVDTSHVHEALFYLCLTPQASLVVRPWPWMELAFSWDSIFAHVPESPTTSGTWPRADAYAGHLALGFFRGGRDGGFRAVLDSSVGIRSVARPAGMEGSGRPRLLIGHMLASWSNQVGLGGIPGQQLLYELHAGLEDRYDPVSFLGDFLDLWMWGFGGRIGLDLGGSISRYLESVAVSLDFAQAIPRYAPSVRASLARPGYWLSGSEIDGVDSRFHYRTLRLLLDLVLWRSLNTGLAYTLRDAYADIQVHSPFGQVFTAAPSNSVSHLLMYYLGYRFP
jgi:hypothetical protein